MCDVALFWIPNKDPKAELGTRVYAETTKMELAENIARGKKIILGIDTEINGTTRMKFLAKRYGIKKVHTSMEGCLAELMERWNKLVKPEDKVFVTGEFGGMDWRKLLNGDIIIADSLPDNGISVISLL